MARQILYLALMALMVVAVTPPAAVASDLEDGISKATDGAISKEDELGQVDHNINFIKLNAKSQARVRSQGATGVVGQDAGGNMNSVLVGPGGSIRGDIIIIDESRGDKTQVVE